MKSTLPSLTLALAILTGCGPVQPLTQDTVDIVCAPHQVQQGGHAILSILQVSPRPLNRFINLKDDTFINEANWERVLSSSGEACGARCYYYMQSIDIGPLFGNRKLVIRQEDFTNLPPGVLRQPIEIIISGATNGTSSLQH